MLRRRAIAGFTIIALVSGAHPARAFVVHPAVTLRASAVQFYAGHLVLEASGNATLDDGTLHVSADRIILDLSADRYVAAGNVQVRSATGPTLGRGAALGIDLKTHKGTLVALASPPATYAIDGAAASSAGPSSPQADREPLALPDLESELPFAQAEQAVAHIGADVRLTSAHVLVPGGKDVPLPSYVYMFSSDPGYAASNLANSGEEVPIYYGSTRSSIDGAHFEYNPVTKVGLGLDHRIVDGNKAYDLFSVSPLNGPRRNANFTWQEQINGHTSQTLSAGSSTGSGSAWNYSLSDGVHRSYLQLFGNTGMFSNSATLVWQGQYEPLGTGWLVDLFDFHLRSEYGRSQAYSGGTSPLFHTTLESGIQSTAMVLNPSTSLSLAADWRGVAENSPHRQFIVDYSTQLQHRWNSFVTTTLSDDEFREVDYYPSVDFLQLNENRLFGQLSYNHGNALAFTLGVEHQLGASAPDIGPFVQPWSASLDVRFRVSPSLSLDLNRSYGFGYLGQRFSSLGFQIFP
jgi:hypothetical protein